MLEEDRKRVKTDSKAVQQDVQVKWRHSMPEQNEIMWFDCQDHDILIQMKRVGFQMLPLKCLIHGHTR